MLKSRNVFAPDSVLKKLPTLLIGLLLLFPAAVSAERGDRRSDHARG